MPVDNLPSRSSVSSSDDTLINPVQVQEMVSEWIDNFIADVVVENIVAEGVIGRDGMPMQQFDAIDNLPDGIRDEYLRLLAAIERCPDIEIANSVRTDAEDAILHSNQTDIRSYIEYLHSAVSSSRPTITDELNANSHTESFTFNDVDDLVQAKANKVDKRSKLFAPIGLELSYHAPISKKKTDLEGLLTFANNINGSIDFNGSIDCGSIAIGSSSFSSHGIEVRQDNAIGGEPIIGTNGYLSQVEGRVLVRQEFGEFGQPVVPMPDTESVPPCEPVPDTEPVSSCDEPEPVGENESNEIALDRALEAVLALSDDPEPVRCTTHLDYTNKLRDILQDAGLLKGYGSKVYKDCGDAIEVCTPIHKNWKSMRDWFAKTNALARAHKFLPWKRTSGGGGMHMNISYNKTVPNWKLAYTNFFILIANHPELNWIFNEPSDNHTANALVLNDRFIRAYHEMATHNMTLTDDLWNDISVCGGKGYSINCKTRFHFELRTFEMVRSSQELHDTIMLVNAMLGFCMEVAEWGVLLPLEVDVPVRYIDDAAEIRGYMLSQDRDEEKFVFDKLMWTGETSFNQLVRDLGLDPKTYRKYVQRNYYTRRGAPYGKKYMS